MLRTIVPGSPRSLVWSLVSWTMLLSSEVILWHFQASWKSVFRRVERAVTWPRKRLDPMWKIAHMIRMQRPLILKGFGACDEVSLNAVEGLNNKLKASLSTSYGYRTSYLRRSTLMGDLPYCLTVQLVPDGHSATTEMTSLAEPVTTVIDPPPERSVVL